MEEVDFSMHAEFSFFGSILSTARVKLSAVRESSDRGWRSDDLLGLVCQTQGPGGGGAHAGSQSQVLGPLPISTRLWTYVSC